MSRLLTVPPKADSQRKIIAPFLASSARVNRAVFEEDHEICKLLPTDAWSSNPLQYISKQEEKIAHFRSSCRGGQGVA